MTKRLEHSLTLYINQLNVLTIRFFCLFFVGVINAHRLYSSALILLQESEETEEQGQQQHQQRQHLQQPQKEQSRLRHGAGAGRGQGHQSGPGQKERAFKEKHKGSWANHNRKMAAQKKRSKGMGFPT